MDKATKFLIKIQSRNRKCALLKEKKQILSKLINTPYCVDECIRLQDEIDFLEKELV